MMTRQQLRHQAISAQFQAGKAKPPTRRQAQAWLAPIKSALAELRTGEVDSYRGYAITQIKRFDEDFARMDHAINGFTALISSVAPDIDISAMTKLSKKLSTGVMLEMADLDSCQLLLKVVENRLIKIPRKTLKDAANTEMIRIELELAGLIEEAA